MSLTWGNDLHTEDRQQELEAKQPRFDHFKFWTWIAGLLYCVLVWGLVICKLTR